MHLTLSLKMNLSGAVLVKFFVKLRIFQLGEMAKISRLKDDGYTTTS